MKSDTPTPVAELREKIAAYRRGRVPKSLRRQQILAEARELFSERGYQATSMDELARRVGVTKPMIYNLVGSKDALFRQLMSMTGLELAEMLSTAIQSQDGIENKLRAGVAAFLRFVEQNRQGWTSLLSMQAAPANAEIAAVRRQQVAIVAKVVASDLDLPFAREDPRMAEVVGNAINGAVEFVASWWLSQPDVPADVLTDLLTQLLAPGLKELLATESSSAAPEDAPG